MEIYGKVQKWIELILSDNLENVARESKHLKNWDVDHKLNKMIFRGLLCLSHTAGRTNPSQIEIGRLMFDITDNLCYSLNGIPDLMKYYSCLYHIIRKLIAMKLYSEAMRITAWSFPSTLVHSLNSQHFNMYTRISDLWYEPAVELIAALPQSKSLKNDHKLLLEFLTNQLKVLEIIARECTAVVLCRIIQFSIKLETIPMNLRPSGYKSYRQIVSNFFSKIKINLITEEKYDVYHDALKFVNLAITGVTGPLNSVRNVLTFFCECYKFLEIIFAGDEELGSCFKIYKNMGVMILKFVDNSKNIAHLELGIIEKEIGNIIKKFYRGQGALWNIQMIGHILQALFERWENSINSGDLAFSNSSVLSDILGLIRLMFIVVNSTQTKGCSICRDNDCKLKKNTYNVSVISSRILVILAKLSVSDFLKDKFSVVRELLEENVAAIYEMKESGCTQWAVLWSNCGVNIYNLSVVCHQKFYEETIFLFSLLCSCIVKFEGMNPVKSKIHIKNPLPYMLHRLSGVHFNHGNYREALTPCALNGLLSYRDPDSKAFRMWAQIKHACQNSDSILKMTMLACLKQDADLISEIGVDIDLSNYDLTDLCLQELRGLHEGRSNLTIAMQSTLDELQILNCGSLDYAQGVNLLGYHQLQHQYNPKFSKYLKQAVKKMKEEKFQGDLHVFASASLDFHAFIMNLYKIIDQTKAETETAKFALKMTKPASDDGRPRNNDTVVPSYTKINISEDSKLFLNLQQALSKWSICIEKNIIGLIEEWHLALTLRTLVIVAEYSRFHGFSTLETRAWELAYKIAFYLKDFLTCVYVVGRGTSLRNINNEWINSADKLRSELDSSLGYETDNVVALFWIGLSNLSFEIGKHSEAAEIMQKVLVLPNISPTKHIAAYLSSRETVLRNYNFFVKENDNTNYMVYIVKCLYAMLSLMDYTSGSKQKQLFSTDVLLKCTACMSLRMNSHLTFREISSHIVHRLKLSQAAGVALRVAECLKNLCLIDLTRMQLDNCVVKLQGLENILQTEYIEESRNTKNPETSTTELDKLGARDPCVNDSSPILRRTVFKVPEFLNHKRCSCYKCSSFDYRYLVLSSTHIRAQLYFLQGHLSDAMEHFNGAFHLRRRMLRIESSQEINGSNKQQGTHPWRDYYHTVEYVLLLLSFSHFLRELKYQDAINVAMEAISVCETFYLQSHPIYFGAKELVLEYQFCETFDDGDFGKFTVPDASSIDISKFIRSASSGDFINVKTPASKPSVNKPKSIRRNKTPPLLNLTKVNMILSEDEDDDEKGSESPKSSYQNRSKVVKNYRRGRTLTRKKLQQYLEAPADSSTSEGDTDEAFVGISRLKVPREFISGETEERTEKEQEAISQIMNRVASMFPNLAKRLTQVLDKKDISDSDKIQQVMNLVEQEGKYSETKTENSDSARSRGRGKNSGKIFTTDKSQLSNKNQSQDIDELVSSFKDILIRNNDASKICPNDARVSQNPDKATPILATVSINNFETDNERGKKKNAKKRLDLSEYSTSIFGSAEPAVTTKLESVHHKERVRTSDRMKRSSSNSNETDKKKFEDVSENLKRCQSSDRKEKPKISVRRRIKEELDAVSAEENQEMQSRIELQNLQRIKTSESSGFNNSTTSRFSDIIESSQINDSDIIPTSDIEDKAIVRQKDIPKKYKTQYSSRITRSRSQMNGDSSVKLNSVSTSDAEELSETMKQDKCGQKGRAKVASKGNKNENEPLDSKLDVASDDYSENPEEVQISSKLTVKKEAGGGVKKRTSKKPTTRGRPRLKS